MQWFSDERAQPVQIGFILLFAILIIAFSLYQATIVPDQNAEVEFGHSQAVERDMVTLRNDIVRAANGGIDGVAQVTLGTGYPSRSFAVNAGPASGTLRTTGLAPIEVTDDAGNPRDVCWDGDVTQSVVYGPSYNYYQNAPTTVYEHTSVFNRYQQSGGPTETVEVAPRLLFEESNKLNLITLWGNVSESGSGTGSFDVYQGRVNQRNISAGSTVTLPTQAETGAPWEFLNESGDIDQVEFDADSDTVQFSVTEEYTVVCTQVGFGEEPPSGVQSLEPPGRSDGEGGRQNGIRYDGGLTTTGSNSAVQFDITNLDGTTATITALQVESRIPNQNASEIWNDPGAEIAITGGQQNGEKNVSGNPTTNALQANGTSIALDTSAELSDSAPSATVFVGNLGSSQGSNFDQYDFENGLTRVSGDDDWDIRITLEFTDRGDVTYYFREV